MLNKKGYTKFELIAVIIMIAIVIAILIPVWLHFQETERQAMDRLEATNAETMAHTEYMLGHYTSGEPAMYMFTGNSEVCQILRHAPYTANNYADITFPRADQYNDGGAQGSGLPAGGRSKKIGDTPLIVVINQNGEIVYNSWKEKLAAKY